MASVKDLYNKTNNYLKRNGIEKTAQAVADSAFTRTPKSFKYQVAKTDELKAQRAWSKRFSSDLRFSIIIPAYETNPQYFSEMAASVLDQTYNNWEMIIVDGSSDMKLREELERTMGVPVGGLTNGREYSKDEVSAKFSGKANAFVEYNYEDGKVMYLHILENGGISSNSNFGVELAEGDYVGFLDHDDILTPDALYAMAKALVSNEYRAKLLYSDEDKTNAKGNSYFEPNRKEDFNLDLFLSNNYICHLAFMEKELIKSLMFRSEYDGAQDYDIFLRAVKAMDNPDERVLHVPKILYHWRCHEGSTAGNPKSKEYAYEAGRKAVADFCKECGWAVTVSHTEHLGFYHIEYKNFFFTTRPNVGVICGPLYKLGKISGGAMRSDGSVIYRGLAKGLGGYLHRGALVQEVDAADVRNIRINPALEDLYEEMVESKLANNSPDYVGISLAFCKKVKELGYKIIYDPNHKVEQ